MNQHDYNLVELYIEGKLEGEALSQFENRLQTDNQLSEALVLRQSMDYFLSIKKEKDALKGTLSNLNGEFFKPDKEAAKIVRLIPFYKKESFQLGGAAAATLMILMIWFLLPAPDLYTQFLGQPQLALIERGETKFDLPKLEREFGNGNFEYSKPELEVYLTAYPKNPRAKIALGICYLELNETQKAQTIFKEIHDGNSALKYVGTWYLGLSYLKHKDFQATLTYLKEIPEGASQYSKAQTLIVEIEK